MSRLTARYALPVVVLATLAGCSGDKPTGPPPPPPPPPAPVASSIKIVWRQRRCDSAAVWFVLGVSGLDRT